MKTKTLVLVRGLPGAGKTSFAKNCDFISCVAADDYPFYNEKGEYKFEFELLPYAHKWCYDKVERWMKYNNIPTIYVHNTFTTEREMKPYFDLAKKYDFRVYTIIVENRHGNKSVHNVPEKTIEKMRNRFDIKL